MYLKQSSIEILEQTSRTFYISIIELPPRIREAVMSSYLSLRAIDEIEDHPSLSKDTKIHLLTSIATTLKTGKNAVCCSEAFRNSHEQLPEVTNRLDEWLTLSPARIAPTIRLATAMMSQRMAYWVENDWWIASKRDLDRYTFSVAGAVGVLLSDLWLWYDGTPSKKRYAVAYGRGLQAVNILRNRTEDLDRGVDFFPPSWNQEQFIGYAKANLRRGDRYVGEFPRGGPAYKFCSGPQELAHATLEALERGKSKLSRSEVLAILRKESFPETEPQAPEMLILVDENDQPIGIEEKMVAHRRGALHRAFSVFVFNNSRELLIQRRAATKYHSGELWSNTCCGHPRPNENIEQASSRRLSEEMGFKSTLKRVFEFIYQAELEDGLIEHEFDHVFVGQFDGTPNPDCAEVAEWKWINMEKLRFDIEQHPHRYTYWFRVSLNRVEEALRYSYSDPPNLSQA